VPRLIVKTKAIVLRRRRLGETSKLVTLYTEEHGKLKVTAKGARQPRSRFGAALEPATEVQAVCYLRPDRELQTLSDCDVLRAFPALLADLERLSLGSAACELVERLTLENEPNRRLYRCLAGVLAGLAEVEPEQAEPLFWYFQLRVAEVLGYRPELRACASCRQPLSGAWLGFSPELGGGVCSACGGPTGLRVPAEQLRFLAGLQELQAYRREAIPRSPARRPEIRGLLRRFLEYHGGVQGRLRSLEFLESVGRDD
jgi:DNA repair protein RecO (recombination protein O)